MRQSYVIDSAIGDMWTTMVKAVARAETLAAARTVHSAGVATLSSRWYASPVTVLALTVLAWRTY